MNLLAEADAPLWRKALWFGVVFIATSWLTLYTMVKSQRLSDFIDALSNDRLSVRGKLAALARVWRPDRIEGVPRLPRRFIPCHVPASCFRVISQGPPECVNPAKAGAQRNHYGAQCVSRAQDWIPALRGNDDCGPASVAPY